MKPSRLGLSEQLVRAFRDLANQEDVEGKPDNKFKVQQKISHRIRLSETGLKIPEGDVSRRGGLAIKAFNKDNRMKRAEDKSFSPRATYKGHEVKITGPVEVTLEESKCVKAPIDYPERADDPKEDGPEIIIGLDFGTSTVKAVIKFRTQQKLCPVKFLDYDDVRQYLLPTKFYIHTDSSASLFPPGREVVNIKNSLLQSPADTSAQREASAFLSLVLKQIRNFVYLRFPTQIKGVKLYWSANMGIPFEELHDIHVGIWTRVLAAAWELSFEKLISLNEADRILQSICFSEHSRTGWECQDGTEVAIFPEISAALYAFAEKIKDRDNNIIYGVVDVGAGTVDAGVFEFHKGRNGRFNTTILDSKVKMIGTSVCHRNRVHFWLNVLECCRNLLSSDKINECKS